MVQLRFGLLGAMLFILLGCVGGGGGSTGTLQINITGLPSGVNANVVVTKPDATTQTFTTSVLIQNAVAGSYTVVANSVTSGSSTYNGTVVNGAATVSAGSTTMVSVTYGLQSAGCPSPAVFDNPDCKFDSATFGP